jgi:spermidine synthase
MPLWFDDTYQRETRFGLSVTRTIYHGRSDYQSIDIFETDLFGKVLALDSVFQTSVGDEYYYHEMLVHPALNTTPRIGNVLVIGGGDGGTVREVLSYPEVERVTMVEIDGMVIEACRRHLPEIGSAWEDPRLTVMVGDGIAFIEGYSGEPFDVIIVDGPDPVGPAIGLFESPFYRNCQQRLGENGALVLQSESPHIMRKSFSRIVRNLRAVFPRVSPYLSPVPIYASGGWSFCHASDRCDPLVLDEERSRRAAARCRYYNGDVHRAVFALPNDIRKLIDPQE